MWRMKLRVRSWKSVCMVFTSTPARLGLLGRMEEICWKRGFQDFEYSADQIPGLLAPLSSFCISIRDLNYSQGSTSKASKAETHQMNLNTRLVLGVSLEEALCNVCSLGSSIIICSPVFGYNLKVLRVSPQK